MYAEPMFSVHGKLNVNRHLHIWVELARIFMKYGHKNKAFTDFPAKSLIDQNLSVVQNMHVSKIVMELRTWAHG